MSLESLLESKLTKYEEAEAKVGKYSPYDYIAKDGTHYLELKSSPFPSTKYGEIYIDDRKFKQLIKLEKPTLLVCLFPDMIAAAWVTKYTEEGDLVFNQGGYTKHRKSPKNTYFGDNQLVEKVLYCIKLEYCKVWTA